MQGMQTTDVIEMVCKRKVRNNLESKNKEWICNREN